MSEILHYNPRETHPKKRILFLLAIIFPCIWFISALAMLIGSIVTHQPLGIAEGSGIIGSAIIIFAFGLSLKEYEYWLFEDKIERKGFFGKRKVIYFNTKQIDLITIIPSGVFGAVSCGFYSKDKMVIKVTINSLTNIQKNLVKEFLYSHFKVNDSYHFFISKTTITR